MRIMMAEETKVVVLILGAFLAGASVMVAWLVDPIDTAPGAESS